MDAIGAECITHVRYVGTGRYHTAKEVVNTAPYLLCVRKVDSLTRKQKVILDNTGCANKGRDNGPFAHKGSGKTKAARFKCEMCENWTDFGDCRYADKCDFFHKGPDDNLPWWPHEAKLHHWLRLQGERGLGYTEAAVISDEEEEHSDAAKAEALSEDVDMGDQDNLAPDHDPLAASSGGAAASAWAARGAAATTCTNMHATFLSREPPVQIWYKRLNEITVALPGTSTHHVCQIHYASIRFRKPPASARSM